MSVIDDYLKTFPPSQKAELERIRAIVKDMVPDAEETIRYEIPTFRFHDKNLIHFAAFKDHLSLFPTSSPIHDLGDKLEKYKTGKGTLQFTEADPIPEPLIREIIQHRLDHM